MHFNPALFPGFDIHLWYRLYTPPHLGQYPWVQYSVLRLTLIFCSSPLNIFENSGEVSARITLQPHASCWTLLLPLLLWCLKSLIASITSKGLVFITMISKYHSSNELTFRQLIRHPIWCLDTYEINSSSLYPASVACPSHGNLTPLPKNLAVSHIVITSMPIYVKRMIGAVLNCYGIKNSPIHIKIAALYINLQSSSQMQLVLTFIDTPSSEARLHTRTPDMCMYAPDVVKWYRLLQSALVCIHQEF